MARIVCSCRPYPASHLHSLDTFSLQVVGSQVYLAIPDNCPIGPDGRKRRVSARSPGVALLISTDDALSFQAACLPLRYLNKVRHASPAAVLYTAVHSVLVLAPQQSMSETFKYIDYSWKPFTAIQGYNLVRTHDGNGAFVIVDHDEGRRTSEARPLWECVFGRRQQLNLYAQHAP